MSIETYLTQTATIHHRSESGTDDYNMPGWSETTSTAATSVETVSATEVGVVALATHRAFFGAGAVIDADDLVTVDGVTYEVVGIPDKENHRRLGTLHHIEVELVEVQD